MCTFNGAAYLLEQLESIVAQALLPFEIVICDDQSSDQTEELVREFSTRSPVPVRWHRNAQQLGVVGNFNQAISVCQGDIIALSDQDDLWVPTKLEALADVLSTRGAMAAFSDAILIDAEGRDTGRTLWKTLGFDPAEQRFGTEDAVASVLNKSFVTGATLALRKNLVPLALPIPNDCPLILHDRWLAVIALAHGGLRAVPQRLTLYRQHDRQHIGAGKPDAAADVRQRLRTGSLTCRDDLIGMRALQVRSATFSLTPDTTLFDKVLAARIVHLCSRVEPNSSPIDRALSVARELLSGRYHRFSNGLPSAIKDILRRN